MKTNNPKINRRKFLSNGLGASAGMVAGATVLTNQAGAVPLNTRGTAQEPYNPHTHATIPTRVFGKTGYKVGILSLGGQAAIEIEGNEDLSERIINRAIDLGVNYIDTAHAYGRGVSETNIGRVMQYRRNEVFLACKTPRRTYDESMKVLEEEMKRLKTDHINLWQLHNVKRQDELDQIFADDGAIKALEKAKSEGMVGHVGITGHYEPLVLKQAIDRYPFDSILLAINAADVHYLSFKNYLLPEALRKGIGIVGMKVATRGRMISSWSPPPIDEQPERMRTGKPGTISIREALTYNMSMPVSTTIIGVDSVEQIEENMKIAADFTPLSDQEIRDIEYKTLPIVRQGLYFRRWEIGA
jgi:predicted aldo/keto reductase-like oxidoreductase